MKIGADESIKKSRLSFGKRRVKQGGSIVTAQFDFRFFTEWGVTLKSDP